MLSEWLGYIYEVMQIVVFLYAMTCCIKRIAAGERSMTLFFFLFGVVSLLMSDFYWIAYSVIKPDVRMPFAANEFGEGAGFLLFSAALGVAFQEKRTPTTKETVLTAFFAAASTVLWIAWTGEWPDDIMTGFMFGYFLCTVVRSMKLSGALSRAEWAALGTGSLVLILTQTLIFLVPAGIKRKLDAFCYILMFVVTAYAFLKTVRSLRDEDPLVPLSLSMASFGWMTSSMYMSADPMYYVQAISSTIMIVIVTRMVLRKVDEV